MPVKIRLMRIGAKKRPFYRIVAIDERKKRSGEYLELLGTYNPLTNPKEIILKQDKIDEWIKKGAVLSDGYLRITKQAPQKQPRAPKKEKKEEPAKVEEAKEETKEEAPEAETTAEEVTTETPVESETVETTEITEEAPVEETKTEEETK
ncbi:MAG: 30S ribosomal protein S16 [Candidatus Daviesbacteria bacterium]|nr:30S ribosomal protein S16 [Candidatus Daviesbacteria bacterium]